MTLDEFAESYKARRAFNMSLGQWKIFPLLVFREQASYDALIMRAWPDTDGEPKYPQEVIKVQISKVRNKIKILGLDIQVVWGKGYFMSKEDRNKVIELARRAMEA